MRDINIKEIAVNNYIYNIKRQEFAQMWKESSLAELASKKDKYNIELLEKEIKSGLYTLNYARVFDVLFKLSIYEVGFLNFLQHFYLKDKVAYTNSTFKLMLQDILNIMYLKQKINMEKYSFVLRDTLDSFVIDKSQLNTELVLTLPEDTKMLAPHEELCNVVETIGWKGLVLITNLIYRVNIIRNS